MHRPRSACCGIEAWFVTSQAAILRLRYRLRISQNFAIDRYLNLGL